MAKTKISEFSATPGNNTDIDGINIAEGCAPSGINDAIRELMSQLKDFQAGTAGDSFNGPVGTTTAAAGAFTTLSASSTVTLSGGTANGVPYLNGSKVLTTGSALTFDGTSLGLGRSAAFLSGAGIEVYRNGVATLRLSNVVSGQENQVELSAETNGPFRFNSLNTKDFAWAFSSSEQMRLTSTGLGIGTSSPGYRLDTLLGAGAGNIFRAGQSGVSNGYTITTSGSALTHIWANGGSDAMRLDSSGNLGLGVTPSAWNSGFKALQVGQTGSIGNNGQTVRYGNNFYYDAGGSFRYIASSYAMMMQLDAGSGGIQFYTAPSGTAGNAITFTQAMTLDASGNLAVGATSAVGRFTLENSATTTEITLRSTGGVGTNNRARIIAGYEAGGSDYGGYLAFNTTSSSNVNTERARIDSSGNLLVGKTSSSATTVGFQTGSNGSAYSTMASSASTESSWNLYSTGASAYRFYVNMAGTVFATSTTISAISDIRYKENVRDLNVGLAEVMALKPRLYDWKEGKGANIKNARGFIAQEFEQVFPDLIDEWKDSAPEGEEPYKSVRADLIPILVKAIQELNAKVEAQAAEIATLKSK